MKVTARDNELDVLRAKIEDNAKKSEGLRKQFDSLCIEQRLLQEDDEQVLKEIENASNFRNLKQQESKEYAEKLRKTK